MKSVSALDGLNGDNEQNSTKWLCKLVRKVNFLTESIVDSPFSFSFFGFLEIPNNDPI